MRGPYLMRVKYDVGPPSPAAARLAAAPPCTKDSKADAGPVRLRVRGDLDALQEADLPKIFPPGTSLADLIETDQVVPGAHSYYAVNLNSTSETIGEGRYAPRQGGPPPPAEPRQEQRTNTSARRA